MHRYCFISLLFFSQSVLIQSVQAQMYQWADPETGTTQLSGKPPAWYRSSEGGPRVFVFNRGKIVDDTGIEISDEQRMSLRTKAFISAEEDGLAAKQKAIESARLKAKMQKDSNEMIEDDVLSDESETIEEEALALETPDDEELIEAETEEDEVSIEKMKALIEEWDLKRTEDAKALLQQGLNDT